MKVTIPNFLYTHNSDVSQSLKYDFFVPRSDEGEWLKALEDGEVDERGYLPKKRGQGNLTARQASVLSRICCKCAATSK